MLSLVQRLAPWPLPRAALDFCPGPQTLLAGTLDLGWYGEVSSSEVVSGEALAALVGLTSGTAINSNAGWLKFASAGKTLFVAKKAIRHSMTLASLEAAGLNFGTRTIQVGNNLFKIRLLTGTVPQANAVGGEWNSLMYKVHVLTSNRWASYSSSDLGLRFEVDDGSISVCQETAVSPLLYPGERVTRGGYPHELEGQWAMLASATNENYGWRPVLEYIGKASTIADAALYAQYRFRNGEAINEVTEQFPAMSGSATVSENRLNSTNQAGNMVGETVVFSANEDFTIEMRHLCTAYSANLSLLGVWAGAGAGTSRWYILYEPGAGQYRFYYRTAAGAVQILGVSRSVIVNTETHIAVTRKGTTIRFFIDGVQVGTLEEGAANDSTSLGLESSLSTYYAGWKSNIRIFRGKCLYEANFVPPTVLPDVGVSEYSEEDHNAMVGLVALRRDAMVNEVDGSPILTTNTCRVANSRIITISQTSSRFTIPLPKKFGVGNWTVDVCVNFSAVTAGAGAIVLGQWYDGAVAHVDNRWCLHVANTRALTLRIKRSLTANDVLVVNGPTLALNTDYRIVAECIDGTVTMKVFDAQLGTEISTGSGAFAQDMVGDSQFWASNRADGGSFAGAMKLWNIVLANKALYNGLVPFRPALPKLRAKEFYSSAELAKIACQFTGRNGQAREEVSSDLITTAGTGAVVNQRLTTTATNSSRWYVPCQSFSAGDFTMEFDLKLLSSSGSLSRPVLGQFRGDVGPNSWTFYTSASGNLAFQCSAADLTGVTIDSASGPAAFRVLSATQEYHVVVQRVAGVLSMYINNVLIGSVTFDKQFADISAYPYITNLWDLATSKYSASEVRNLRIVRDVMYPGGTITRVPFKHIKVNKPSLYIGHNGLTSVMQGGMENLNYLNQWQSAGLLSHTLFRDVRDPQNVKVVRLLGLIYERSYTVIGWRTLEGVTPTDDMPQFTGTLKIAGGNNLNITGTSNASVNNGEGKYWGGNMLGTITMGRAIPFEFV